MMVGKLLSFWECNSWGARLNFQGVYGQWLGNLITLSTCAAENVMSHSVFDGKCRQHTLKPSPLYRGSFSYHQPQGTHEVDTFSGGNPSKLAYLFDEV